MTYKPQVLVEINEATIDNMMCGPMVEIVRDTRNPFSQINAKMNTQGFEKYHGLLSEYEADGFFLNEPGIYGPRGGYYFSPDIHHIRDPKK